MCRRVQPRFYSEEDFLFYFFFRVAPPLPSSAALTSFFLCVGKSCEALHECLTSPLQQMCRRLAPPTPSPLVVARYVCYACVCVRVVHACAGRRRAVPIQEPVGSSPINGANNRRPFIPEDAHPSARMLMVCDIIAPLCHKALSRVQALA